jgi:tetratricopeptide (TPR) repeat protein
MNVIIITYVLSAIIRVLEYYASLYFGCSQLHGNLLYPKTYVQHAPCLYGTTPYSILPQHYCSKMERIPSFRSKFQQTCHEKFFNKSFNGLQSGGFSVLALKDLLSKLVPICQDVDRASCQHIMDLVMQQRFINDVPTDDELEEVACLLEGFLSPIYYEHMDKALLVDIHSCAGLIRQQQGLLDRAIRSLLMALWLQQKDTVNKVAVAITEHRLGLVYAKKGDYKKAIHLLEKALLTYMESKMRTGHSCILEVEHSLSLLRICKLKEEMEMLSSVSERLSGIDELVMEDEEPRLKPKSKKNVLRARSA